MKQEAVMTAVASLAERYTEVLQRIADAAARSGRPPDRVLLVAVTKFADPAQIRALIRLGHLDLGENRVQHMAQNAAMVDEWLARHRAAPNAPWPEQPAARSARPEQPRPGDPRDLASLSTPPRQRDPGEPGPPERVRWHMIGRLQRNKVRKALEFTRLIHSIDSLRLAEEVHAAAQKRDQVIDVLLQVNASGEGAKQGCSLPAAIHLADQIATMMHVRLRGLMTIAPLVDDPEQARPVFARTRELFDEIREAGVGAPDFNILSMGMSGDYEVAIEEGANLVRVGSAIFGAPPPGAEDADEDDDEG